MRIVRNNSNKHFADDFQEIKQFSKIIKNHEINKNLLNYGISHMSSIQVYSLPYILEGRDIIYQGKSGTGKTTSYIIGLLCLTDILNPKLQSLVLLPTRELAFQIYSVFRSLAFHNAIRIGCVYGGRWIGMDIDRIVENKFHILIGTPGRVFHILEIKKLKLEDLNILVLDEADILLNDNFKLETYGIYKYIPNDCQHILVSSTFSYSVLRLAMKFMNNPIKILAKREEVNSKYSSDFYLPVFLEENKFYALINFFENSNTHRSMIFCNTINKAIWLYNKLQNFNYQVGVLHGKMTQSERTSTFTKFMNFELKYLITTDVLSRGIDVHETILVINYDMPLNRDTYIHRMGRTGRYGRKGVIVNFATLKDLYTIIDLEIYYYINFEDLVTFY